LEEFETVPRFDKPAVASTQDGREPVSRHPCCVSANLQTDSLAAYEREVRDQEGRRFSLRVRPYRTKDNHIDGAVLQLLDVDELKRALEQVRCARDYATAIVQTVREPYGLRLKSAFLRSLLVLV
jgi:hypothetical protein